MTEARTTRRWFAGLIIPLFILAGAVFEAGLSADPAAAQSSVRPPAGATTDAGPPGPPPGGAFPGRGNLPSAVTGGNVPGGSMGTASDAELWRAVRKGITGTVSIPDKQAGQLVQSEGDNWRAIRNGPLAEWGAWGMGSMIVLLLIFYLTRGRITIEAGPSGKTITRFAEIERMAHWLLAVSFIILAITGLNITYGKHVLLPLIGKAAFADITYVGKWLHNYLAFPFIVGLVLVFVLWIKDNFPNKHDAVWVMQTGGMFMKGVHPPSKKFNAGQKVIFWLVIIGGGSLAASGIAMMFPFQTSMFAGTFAILNTIGFDLPTNLTPLQEMQLATIWHAMVALFMIVVILAHIYIGSVGMQGAFDAMSSGEVDRNWAKEHHSIWAEAAIAEAEAKDDDKPKVQKAAKAVPAE